MRSHRLLLVAFAVLVAAACAYLGTGLHPIWWMLWLAPIPVLAIAPQLCGGAVFLLGSVAWLIGETNQWNYVTHAMDIIDTTENERRFGCRGGSACLLRIERDARQTNIITS